MKNTTQYIEWRDRTICIDWDNGEPILSTLNGGDVPDSDGLIEELKADRAEEERVA